MTFLTLPALFGGLLVWGCSAPEGAQDLSKGSDDSVADVPVPPANAPKLGALAYVTPVYDRLSDKGTRLGALYAGAMVPRSAEPLGKNNGCEGGWYAIRPRGFVCAGTTATTDLSHPTLVAMAQQPKRDATLPYTYARTARTTTIYERDPKKSNAVRPKGKIRGRSGLAIVGSWNALDEEGQMQRLGMMTNGHFVKAADLKKSDPVEFSGTLIDDKTKLPLAFVVKRGVRDWHVEKGDSEKRGKLKYHEMMNLTGRYRTVGKVKYWATTDDRYVRHQDVTTARKRNNFPAFAVGEQKWVDISIVTGTMVAYEGQRPVYASLVSVGRNRLDDKGEAITKRGEFKVVAKHISATSLDPQKVAAYWDVYDTPWVLEMESGQVLHAAFWHSRFGIEHTNGNVHLSPKDAAWMFSWATPGIPEDWNSASSLAKDEESTIINIRK